MNLEEKLTALRKERGLSQLELAEKLDVSRQAVSKWETGTAVPSTESLRALSQLYKVPVDDLLRDGEWPAQKKAAEQPAGSQARPQTETKNGRVKRYIAAAAAVLLILAACIGVWGFSQREESHDLGKMSGKEVVIDSTFSVDW